MGVKYVPILLLISMTMGGYEDRPKNITSTSIDVHCLAACNTTYALEYLGFSKCIEDCPVCRKLSPLGDNEEKPTNQDVYLEEKCTDICAPRDSPEQDIICQMRCPKTWCGTRSNSQETTLSPSPPSPSSSHMYIGYALTGVLFFIVVLGVTIKAIGRNRIVSAFGRMRASISQQKDAPATMLVDTEARCTDRQDQDDVEETVVLNVER